MKRISRVRALGITAASVIFACTLVSCEQFDLGPASVAVDDDGIRIASCVSMTIELAFGQYRTSEGYRTFLDVTGDGELTRGQPIALDEVPEGMVGTSSPVPVDDVDYVVIRLAGPAEDFAAGFDGAKLGALSPGEWLHPDGSTTQEPCAEPPQ